MNQERINNALVDSLKLSASGQPQEALRLLDEVIAEAMREGEELWAFIFIDHAAVLSARGQPDRSLRKRYYEQYLTYRPENPRALYGLADVAMEDGQTETAKLYAKRCHQALLETEDKIAKKDLFDLVLERWPELSSKS